MSTRLASMMVSLHRELPVRLLVPRRTASGKLEYRVEMRSVRLPLRRDDRDLFRLRLASD